MSNASSQLFHNNLFDIKLIIAIKSKNPTSQTEFIDEGIVS